MCEAQENKFRKIRYLIAFFYWIIPITIFLIIYFRCGAGVLARPWFKIIFAIFAGCWGLTMRAISLKKDPDNPFPDYVTLYILAIIMNGFAIFTFLALVKLTCSPLYYTAALPLGMFMGFNAHPGFWIIGKILDHWSRQNQLYTTKS